MSLNYIHVHMHTVTWICTHTAFNLLHLPTAVYSQTQRSRHMTHAYLTTKCLSLIGHIMHVYRLHVVIWMLLSLAK